MYASWAFFIPGFIEFRCFYPSLYQHAARDGASSTWQARRSSSVVPSVGEKYGCRPRRGGMTPLEDGTRADAFDTATSAH